MKSQKERDELEAKQAAQRAEGSQTQAPLIPWNLTEGEKPRQSQKERHQALERAYTLHASGWFQSEEGKVLIPDANEWKVLKAFHQAFHLGIEKTHEIPQRLFLEGDLLKTIEQVI